MKINSISQNYYKPNFGVNVDYSLKKGLYDNLMYMQDKQGASEKKILYYADKINEKQKEIKEWDSDVNCKFDYKEVPEGKIHITDESLVLEYKNNGIIKENQIIKAKKELSKEGEKSRLCEYKTGWINVPQQGIIPTPYVNGIDLKDRNYKTFDTNVYNNIITAKKGKDFINGFLNITKEMYLASRKESTDKFLVKCVVEDNYLSGEDVLNRASKMGKDSGKMFKDDFFKKFPEKKEDVTDEMLRLSNIKNKIKFLYY